MNSKIKKLESQIEEAKNEVASRVESLKISIGDDQALLNQFVDKYTYAVQIGAGEDELNRLEIQRNEAIKRVEQSAEIIKILTSEPSLSVRQLKVDLVEQYIQEMRQLNSEVSKLVSNLNKDKTKIITGFDALNKMREQIDEYKKSVNFHAQYLDDSDRNSLEIPEDGYVIHNNYRVTRDPIEQSMVDMLIEMAETVLNPYEADRIKRVVSNRGGAKR